MVENYEKGEVRELDSDFSPFGPEFSNVTIMKVKIGSKLHSLVSYAEKQLEADTCRHIIFSGIGPACTKTISSVEVLKRRLKFELHQITRAKFKRVEEYWEPKAAGLERLKVNRDIPAVCVLLSKDPLPTSDPGYQGPGHDVPLIQSDKPVYRRQQQQTRRRATESSSKDGNKWRRPQKGNAKDKKRYQTMSESNAKASESSVR